MKDTASSAGVCERLLTTICSSAIDNGCRDRASSTGASVSPAGVREPRFFPRRALMYVPACDERKTKKALSLKVDSIVFDIEDGVAVNQKAG